MTDSSEAFAPLAGSENTLATFKNPFGFSLQVVDSGENITLASDGTDIAEVRLNLLYPGSVGTKSFKSCSWWYPQLQPPVASRPEMWQTSLSRSPTPLSLL